MHSTASSQNTQHHTKKSAEILSVSAGFAQLKRVANESRLKAYIEDHEAWALVLLTILLIAGTFLYGRFQPPPDAGSGQAQSSAPVEVAEAPVKLAEARLPERPSSESSFSLVPLVQENPPAIASGISNPPSQSFGLISSGKRDNRLVKRKAAHHHHRR